MKIGTIIKKEYKQIVKKKSFVIVTILTPVMMAAFIFLPMLLTKVAREQKIIEIADYSGLILQSFQERSKTMKEGLKLKFQPVADLGGQQESLIQEYEKKAFVGHVPAKSDVSLQLIKEYQDRILEKR